MQTSVRRYETIALGLLKKEEEEELERRMPNHDFFTSRGAFVNLRYNYSDLIIFKLVKVISKHASRIK